MRAGNRIFTRIRLHRGPNHTFSMRPVVNVPIVPVVGSGNLSTENGVGRDTPQLMCQAHFLSVQIIHFVGSNCRGFTPLR